MIRKLCLKNEAVDKFVSETGIAIDTLLKEVSLKKQAKVQASTALRDQVENSYQMKQRKKQIADAMGMHTWPNFEFSPIPLPTDGHRMWRERKKQRDEKRKLVSAGSETASQAISVQPMTPLSPGFDDSSSFSMMNATVEISKMPANFSALNISDDNPPDFLLDISSSHVS